MPLSGFFPQENGVLQIPPFEGRGFLWSTLIFLKDVSWSADLQLSWLSDVLSPKVSELISSCLVSLISENIFSVLFFGKSLYIAQGVACASLETLVFYEFSLPIAVLFSSLRRLSYGLRHENAVCSKRKHNSS